jgi:hypothetical protein
VQSTLDQRQRLQQLFFPDGVAFDGKRFDRTAVSTPAFNWLEVSEDQKTSVVALTCARSNQFVHWMLQVERYRQVA